MAGKTSKSNNNAAGGARPEGPAGSMPLADMFAPQPQNPAMETPAAEPLQTYDNSSQIRTNTDIANMLASVGNSIKPINMSEGPSNSTPSNPIQATDIVATPINTQDVIVGLNQSTSQIMEALNTVNISIVSGLNTVITKVESQESFLSKLEGYGEDTQLKLNELFESISRMSYGMTSGVNRNATENYSRVRDNTSNNLTSNLLIGAVAGLGGAALATTLSNNTGTGSNDTTAGSDNNVNITSEGSDIKARLIEDLRASGYSDVAIAGILASVENESAFDLNAVGDNGASKGLFQWNSNAGRGPSGLTYEEQFSYFQKEMGKGGEFEVLGEMLKNAKTPIEANAIMARYEKYQGYNDVENPEYRQRLKDTERYITELQSSNQNNTTQQQQQQSPDAQQVSSENVTGQTGNRVAEMQSSVAGVRTMPLNPELKNILETISAQNDVYAEVVSGGQPSEGPNRVGSERHDEGLAGDVKFYKMVNGEKVYLDLNNPSDIPVLQKIVTDGKKLGITGVGMGEDYMGPNTIHLGFGSEAVWGAKGKRVNAPDWLVSAFEGTAAGQSPYLNASYTPGAENPLNMNMGMGTDSFALVNQVMGGNMMGSMVGQLSTMTSLMQSLPQIINPQINNLTQRLQETAGNDMDFTIDPSNPKEVIPDILRGLFVGVAGSSTGKGNQLGSVLASIF